MQHSPFDDLFERMSRGFGGMDAGVAGAHTVDVDVEDAGDEVVVAADLPGFDREDIDVSVSGHTLTLRADRDHESHDEHEGLYVRRERRHESLSRSLSLPADVDEGAAVASYRNGVLTVRLPKVDVDEDARHIDVE
jgi:HSP20 family protein